MKDGRVAVPMTVHSKLHEGHLQLIDYAKSFGAPHVVMWTSTCSFGTYSQTGRQVDDKIVDASQAIQQLKDLKVDYSIEAFTKHIWSKESDWLAAHKKATDIVNIYQDYLYTDYLRHVVLISLMQKSARKFNKGVFKGNWVIVRGPPISSFIWKRIYQRIHSNTQMEIFPKIVIDPITKVSYSSWPSTYEWWASVGSLISEIRDRFKVGRNETLVQELNSAYRCNDWEFHEIIVWENELVNGRLELVQIAHKPKEGGLYFLEASYYETN